MFTYMRIKYYQIFRRAKIGNSMNNVQDGLEGEYGFTRGNVDYKIEIMYYIDGRQEWVQNFSKFIDGYPEWTKDFSTASKRDLSNIPRDVYEKIVSDKAFIRAKGVLSFQFKIAKYISENKTIIY